MSNQPPSITIVTPTYNQAAYVEETIQSILSQDYPGIDYVVIDDGSTDGTPAVLERYAQRCTVIRQANMGQARTLNKGWEASGSKYLSYLSSDDKLRPEAISKLIAVLEADPDVVCVFPDSDLIDEGSRVIKRNVCQGFDLTQLVVRQECYIGPGAVFRASAFHAAGGWRPELRLAPDREFWIRMAAFGKFHFLQEALAEYRLHRESISYKEVSEAVSSEYLQVLNDYFAEPSRVPANILQRRDEAFAHAEMVVARNLLRAGKISRGIERYRKARQLHPALGSPRVRLQLVKNVISKPLRQLAARVHGLLR